MDTPQHPTPAHMPGPIERAAIAVLNLIHDEGLASLSETDIRQAIERGLAPATRTETATQADLLDVIAHADVPPGHVAYLSKARICELARAAIARAKGQS
jgi:hypothetical protein